MSAHNFFDDELFGMDIAILDASDQVIHSDLDATLAEDLDLLAPVDQWNKATEFPLGAPPPNGLDKSHDFSDGTSDPVISYTDLLSAPVQHQQDLHCATLNPAALELPPPPGAHSMAMNSNVGPYGTTGDNTYQSFGMNFVDNPGATINNHVFSLPAPGVDAQAQVYQHDMQSLPGNKQLGVMQQSVARRHLEQDAAQYQNMGPGKSDVATQHSTQSPPLTQERGPEQHTMALHHIAALKQNIQGAPRFQVIRTEQQAVVFQRNVQGPRRFHGMGPERPAVATQQDSQGPPRIQGMGQEHGFGHMAVTPQYNTQGPPRTQRIGNGQNDVVPQHRIPTNSQGTGLWQLDISRFYQIQSSEHSQEQVHSHLDKANEYGFQWSAQNQEVADTYPFGVHQRNMHAPSPTPETGEWRGPRTPQNHTQTRAPKQEMGNMYNNTAYRHNNIQGLTPSPDYRKPRPQLLKQATRNPHSDNFGNVGDHPQNLPIELRHRLQAEVSGQSEPPVLPIHFNNRPKGSFADYQHLGYNTSPHITALDNEAWKGIPESLDSDKSRADKGKGKKRKVDEFEMSAHSYKAFSKKQRKEEQG